MTTNSTLGDANDGDRVWTRHLGKVYPGGVRAVIEVNLNVRDGEFLTLLGPSGSGKSTTLRMLIGLEVPTEGTVGSGQRVLSSVRPRKWVEPNDRDFGMVFQSYALWPNMSVLENVRFPLDVRKVKRRVAVENALQALDRVGLKDFSNRSVATLSGGQQQRVAIARAVVHSPEVLLLDEPLSNLDPALRTSMREDLKDLQSELGITAIYVTHDQSEAFAMSDRIAVMNAGRVEQIATPTDLYEKPATAFVAEFIGASNVLSASGDREAQHVTLPSRDPTRPPARWRLQSALHGGEVLIAVKPSDLEISAQGPGSNEDDVSWLAVKCVRVTYLGDCWEVTVDHVGKELRARTNDLPSLPSGGRVTAGDQIWVRPVHPARVTIVRGKAHREVSADRNLVQTR